MIFLNFLMEIDSIKSTISNNLNYPMDPTGVYEILEDGYFYGKETPQIRKVTIKPGKFQDLFSELTTELQAIDQCRNLIPLETISRFNSILSSDNESKIIEASYLRLLIKKTKPLEKLVEDFSNKPQVCISSFKREYNSLYKKILDSFTKHSNKIMKELKHRDDEIIYHYNLFGTKFLNEVQLDLINKQDKIKNAGPFSPLMMELKNCLMIEKSKSRFQSEKEEEERMKFRDFRFRKGIKHSKYSDILNLLIFDKEMEKYIPDNLNVYNMKENVLSGLASCYVEINKMNCKEYMDDIKILSENKKHPETLKVLIDETAKKVEFEGFKAFTSCLDKNPDEYSIVEGIMKKFGLELTNKQRLYLQKRSLLFHQKKFHSLQINHIDLKDMEFQDILENYMKSMMRCIPKIQSPMNPEEPKEYSGTLKKTFPQMKTLHSRWNNKYIKKLNAIIVSENEMDPSSEVKAEIEILNERIEKIFYSKYFILLKSLIFRCLGYFIKHDNDTINMRKWIDSYNIISRSFNKIAVPLGFAHLVEVDEDYIRERKWINN